MFGHSRTKRFTKNRSIAPGPGTYDLKSNFVLKKGEQKEKKSNKGVFNQMPVGVWDPTINELEKQESPPEQSETNEALQSKKMELNDKSGLQRIPQKAQGKMIRAIKWKRKYLPPSIPMGKFAHGYQENEDGDLVPRKPPKVKAEPESQTQFSFVEKAKHENRGPQFGVAAPDEDRLVFKVLETPAPNLYDPLSTGTHSGNAALMTLAPCQRITDAIVNEAVKKGVPGPGAYDLKAPLQQKLMEPRNRIKLGAGKGGTSYINPDHAAIPGKAFNVGPGAYYPEQASHPKPRSYKPQPFGSSTKRFEKESLLHPPAPAVGSYDVETHHAIGSTPNRIAPLTEKKAVFGSIGDRFVYKKPVYYIYLGYSTWTWCLPSHS